MAHRARVLIVLAICSLSAGLLTACGGDDSGSTQSGTTAAGTSSAPASTTAGTATKQEATAAATGQLDQVTWNIPDGEPRTLDFAGVGTGEVALVNMCEAPQERDPQTGELKPALAESVETPNPTTVVFNLRSGVKFWDGNPLTPEDVIYSFKRIGAPDSPSAHFYERVKSITKTGPLQVTVKFKQPDASFIPVTASLVATGIMEKAFAEQAGDKYGTPSGGVMCTGPYKFDKWTPGGELTMVPNQDFWDQERVPKVGRLVFKFITDTSAITAALLSGELDGTMGVPPTAIEQLRNSDRGTVLTGTGSDTRQILPMGGENFRSADIRSALNLVIDRAGIAKGVFNDTAKPGVSYYPPWSWTFETDTFQQAAAALPGLTPDIEAAKAAFEKAGSPTTPITLGVLGSDQLSTRTASIIQASAQQIGMNIKIVSLPASRYNNLYFEADARKGLDAALLFSFYLSPDPGEEMPFYWVPGAAANYIDYGSPELTKLVEESRTQTDEAKRAQILVQAQEIAVGRDSFPMTLVNLDFLSFIKNGIGGYTSSGYNRFYPWAAGLGATG